MLIIGKGLHNCRHCVVRWHSRRCKPVLLSIIVEKDKVQEEKWPANTSEQSTWKQRFSRISNLGTCTCKAKRRDTCSSDFSLVWLRTGNKKKKRKKKKRNWKKKSAGWKLQNQNHKKPQMLEGKRRKTSIRNNRQNKATARLALKWSLF